MKYRPILFQTEMVQGVLEGRKNQTRRLKGLEEINATPEQYRYQEVSEELPNIHYFERRDESGMLTDEYFDIPVPYQVGDVLWVRETFRLELSAKGNPPLSTCIYKADYKDVPYKYKWKPSIFMKKMHARIFLEVVNVRAERLREISENDAINEGVKYKETRVKKYFWDYIDKRWILNNARHSFMSLWIKINGYENLKLNPFVWIIEFKRIEKPENF
ncbi:MAG: hypothetical protein ABI207_06125 [Crocinitomicaceae bacterium]